MQHYYTQQHLTNLDKFYVITVISNPVRYKTRFGLYERFQKHITDLGAQLITVEMAFGSREFAITDKNNPMHLQLRSSEEIWHKENMINLGIQHIHRIDPHWKYVAWIDADICFQRPDIIEETAQQLQHYDIVQMLSHAIDLGPEMQPFRQYDGFMYSYIKNGCNPPPKTQFSNYDSYYNYYTTKGSKYWHCGYAWAGRRSAMEKINLIDFGIIGAGDHHMANCLIGCGERSLPGKVSKNYKHAVMEWQDMVYSELRLNVGYVPGTITHYWHGAKVNRKYNERWNIIFDNAYDPYSDISRDSQGLIKLNLHKGPRLWKMRDQLRQYARDRNEDSIDFSDSESKR